jgi:hypothetical protein
MPEARQLNPARLRLMLWVAQLGTVLLLGVLAWLLPALAGLGAAPAVADAALIAGLAAIPAAPIGARLLGAERARSDVKIHTADAARAPAVPSESDHGRFVVVLALCELPALLGLIHALFGGDPLYASALAGVSVLLLMIHRPVA